MPTEDDRRDRLHDSIRQIVVTRERTPRSPNWALAWRRTLLKYVDQLNPRPSEGLSSGTLGKDEGDG